MLTPDVVIVGGGPAGLTAASALAALGVRDVLVLEREVEAGGIPRHSHHTGYGLRDVRAVLTGPAYARRLVRAAQSAGADVRTGAMVTGWASGGRLRVTTPDGLLDVAAGAVVLATGARERPRSARLIPGDRPAGIYTTGQLQNAIHLHQQHIGTRAVVVGAELVSWSAVLTLRSAGCATVLMTTEHEVAESYAAMVGAARLALRVPVSTSTRVARIIGRDRVEAVELVDDRTGARSLVECDTVVLTGQWIPDHELARSSGLDLDPGSLGPVVDTALRTSQPGVFAAGNLLHPVDTADVAALDGRHVAQAVVAWLADPAAILAPPVAIHAADPFRWVAPGLLRPGDPAPPRERLLLWADTYQRFPRVVVRQQARLLSRRTLPWPVSPGRVFRVPWSMVSQVDPLGGPIVVGLG